MVIVGSRAEAQKALEETIKVTKSCTPSLHKLQLLRVAYILVPCVSNARSCNQGEPCEPGSRQVPCRICDQGSCGVLVKLLNHLRHKSLKDCRQEASPEKTQIEFSVPLSGRQYIKCRAQGHEHVYWQVRPRTADRFVTVKW